MNEEHWKNFYKKRHTLRPSKFAKFIVKYFKGQDVNFYDLGCGNGRDTYYIGKKFRVLGVDKATKPKKKDLSVFMQKDINTIGTYSPDVVYTRFLLHAIEDEEIDRILMWTKKYFVAECRAFDDSPSIYLNHFRYLVNGNDLIEKLIQNGFEILYYEKGHGMAKYRGEDPSIIRVIAKKNN